MLKRPNHDSGQANVEDMVLGQASKDTEEETKKVEPNANFIKSIEELQLFFDQYNGTHSER